MGEWSNKISHDTACALFERDCTAWQQDVKENCATQRE